MYVVNFNSEFKLIHLASSPVAIPTNPSLNNTLQSQPTSNSFLNAFATRILMEVCRSCIPFMASHIVSRHHDIDLTLSCIIGGKDLEEGELLHIDGHKGPRPVRVGNGAADYVQLVRGLLMLTCVR